MTHLNWLSTKSLVWFGIASLFVIGAMSPLPIFSETPPGFAFSIDAHQAGQTIYPQALGVDFNGKLYVSSLWQELKFDTNGALLEAWGSPGTGPGKFSYAGQTAFDRSGHVFILDSYNARIEEFDTDGNFVSEWGSQGPGPGEFDLPYGVAAGSDGRIYVSDGNNNRIQTFSSPGVLQKQFGEIGTNTGQFSFPESIAIDSSNNLYVLDVPGGAFDNYRVQKFDSDGNFLMEWGPPGVNTAGSIQLGGIATDPQNNVYVADGANHRVQKFTSAGVFLSEWGSFGSAPGQFNQPSGIALDPTGNYVYVSDNYNARVEVFAYAPLDPLIYLPPTNQVVPAGIDLSLAVGVFGAKPVSYQWRYAGQDILGATESSIAFTNISLGASGAYSIVASNAFGRATSPVGLLTVEPLVLSTLPATNFSATGGTLKSLVWVGSYPSTVWFEWGAGTNYGNVAGLTEISTNRSILFTNFVDGLDGNSVYHYRVAGSNALGIVYGADMPFQVGLKPSVVTLPVVQNGSNSVFLQAQVNPAGRDTAAFIHYGRFNASGSSTPTNSVPGDVVTTTLKDPITGLLPGLVYFAQAFASNSAGLFVGNVIRFMAPPVELLPTPGGRQWTAVATTADGSRLLAGASGEVFLSLDSGMSWSTNLISTASITAVSMSADGTNLVVGSGAPANITGPAFVSTNGGKTWGKALSTNRNWFSLGSSADGTRVAAVDAFAHAVVTSSDRGMTWETNSPPVFANWSSIASSADGQSLIVAGGGFNGSTNGPVFTSTNAGTSWNLASLPVSNWKAVACSSDGRVLAAVAGGLRPGGIYLSIDAGQSWGSTGAPYTNWQAVAISADGKRIVALARVEANPLYISNDMGGAWQNITLPPAIWTALAISADGRTIFASGDQNIIRLQTVGGPELVPAFHDGSLSVSWLIGTGAYQLQQAPDLSGSGWSSVALTPIRVLTNLQYRINLPLTGTAGFYRLQPVP
jgi:sugar lactone lactonase YvrE